MKTLAGLAVVSLIVLGSGKLLAQDFPVKLNVALTATYQLEDTTSGNIAKLNTKSVRLTSQTLLSLVATNLGTNFPAGTALAVANDNVVALDKQGNQTDLSSFFTTTNQTSVARGQANTQTGAGNAASTVYFTIHFDDGNGNSFTMDGLLKGTSTLSTPDAYNNQKESLSVSGTLVGYGSVNGNDAVFSGTISGSGKGASGGA
jgi:hypothetical protein